MTDVEVYREAFDRAFLRAARVAWMAETLNHEGLMFRGGRVIGEAWLALLEGRRPSSAILGGTW